jgi:hypothetical protein
VDSEERWSVDKLERPVFNKTSLFDSFSLHIFFQKYYRMNMTLKERTIKKMGKVCRPIPYISEIVTFRFDVPHWSWCLFITDVYLCYTAWL